MTGNSDTIDSREASDMLFRICFNYSTNGLDNDNAKLNQNDPVVTSKLEFLVKNGLIKKENVYLVHGKNAKYVWEYLPNWSVIIKLFRKCMKNRLECWPSNPMDKTEHLKVMKNIDAIFNEARVSAILCTYSRYAFRGHTKTGASISEVLDYYLAGLGRVYRLPSVFGESELSLYVQRLKKFLAIGNGGKELSEEVELFMAFNKHTVVKRVS